MREEDKESNNATPRAISPGRRDYEHTLSLSLLIARRNIAVVGSATSVSHRYISPLLYLATRPTFRANRDFYLLRARRRESYRALYVTLLNFNLFIPSASGDAALLSLVSFSLFSPSSLFCNFYVNLFAQKNARCNSHRVI